MSCGDDTTVADLVIESDVHKIAVHVSPQEVSPDQMGEVCVREGSKGHSPPGGGEAGALTELLQVFASDKLVVLVDCRLRSLLQLFRQAVQEGAPSGGGAQ